MMVRFLPALFLLLTLAFSGFGQEHQLSSLYANDGKLRKDNSLAISAEQFNIWWKIEGNVVATISSNLTYPPICLRNALEGKLVAAFEFTGTEIMNIRIVDKANAYFEEAAIQAVQKSAAIIVKEFQFYQLKTEAKGTYYIPLDFEIIDLRKEVKKRGAIPVIQPDAPNFQHRNIIDGLKGK